MVKRSHDRRRTGFIRFIGNVVDDAKEFTDECLDRIGDLERDLRRTVSDSIRSERDADARHAPPPPSGRAATGQTGGGRAGSGTAGAGT
ncbi:hypothetical protein ACQEVS_00395 [Streptomyces sp. CA-181903]|uniref:hypothetical protein n=1 Tax=Streptomyces sp. CA-181903 TaxID=3240055 RepID=UPI003D8EA809